MANKYYNAFQGFVKAFTGAAKPGVKSNPTTIIGVKPNVPKTKTEKAKSKLKIATQKTKGSQAKLDQAIFNLQEQNRSFKKAREKKMGGGMMNRRFGMKAGTPNPFKKETNVDKINKTFGSKGKNLKPVDKKKNPGLAKLPTEVRNKMGYMKSGGRAGFMGGGAGETTREKEKFQLDKNISKVKEKMKGLKLTKTQEEQLKDRSRKIGSNVYRRKP